MRISTPAVPDDWRAKMWTVFKEQLDKSAPGQFDVQIHLGGALFKQGTEPVAMARGNLELASISAFDIAKLVPEFSLFTAGYVIRDPAHLMKVFNGPVGAELFKKVSEKMNLTVLSPLYLGTRQLNLREARKVTTPADLKGVKLRMPGSKEWLFLGEALGATPTPLAFGEVHLGLKTGTIDGQDNPLPTVRSAKFFEVTKQITLTSHLVDGLFICVANKLWKSLDAAQRAKLQAAAQAAAAYNNDKRLADEKELVAFFKAQGLSVTTPDVDAFRKSVQAAYPHSDYAKAWPAETRQRHPLMRQLLRRCADVVGVVLFALLFLVFVVQVTARFVFATPLTWTDEAAVVLYLWAVLWGAAVVCKDREQVAFDLLDQAAPPQVRRLMALTAAVLVGGLAAWALPGTLDYILFMQRESSAVLGLPLHWVFMPFALLLLALLVRYVIRVWQLLRQGWERHL